MLFVWLAYALLSFSLTFILLQLNPSFLFIYFFLSFSLSRFLSFHIIYLIPSLSLSLSPFSFLYIHPIYSSIYASLHLFKRAFPWSGRPSVCPSVGPSVGPWPTLLFKMQENASSRMWLCQLISIRLLSAKDASFAAGLYFSQNPLLTIQFFVRQCVCVCACMCECRQAFDDTNPAEGEFIHPSFNQSISCPFCRTFSFSFSFLLFFSYRLAAPPAVNTALFIFQSPGFLALHVFLWENQFVEFSRRLRASSPVLFSFLSRQPDIQLV